MIQWNPNIYQIRVQNESEGISDCFTNLFLTLYDSDVESNLFTWCGTAELERLEAVNYIYQLKESTTC